MKRDFHYYRISIITVALESVVYYNTSKLQLTKWWQEENSVKNKLDSLFFTSHACMALAILFLSKNK